MLLTKTKFINYTRCNTYAKIDLLNNKPKDSISYKEYKEEEFEEEKRELLGQIFEENIEIKNNSQVDAMLPYYKQVEQEAGNIATKYFGGSFIYAEKTENQQKFEAKINDDKFICFVDLFNGKQIIEVKATTTKTLMNMEVDNTPVFIKENNVLRLNNKIDITKKLDKLLDRFSDEGKYFFDLAVQRYIIEHSTKNKSYDYYLAFLNHNYIYDGSGNYDMINNEELICFIDANQITKMYQEKITQMHKNLYISLNEKTITKVGNYCARAKLNECPFFKTICGKDIPKTNSIFNYLNCYQFKDEKGINHKCIDLVNDGYLDMLDIPNSWINSKKHEIQRNCYKNNEIYIDKEKINAGLNQIKYPIYHLDFETFPCPIPRFKGERPYTQSPFEFSLHIENEPGKCDFNKDHHIFLAKTFDLDEREDLIKALISYTQKSGTMLAQNYSFEKSRIIELANCFPKYKIDLLKIIDNCFDLIWLLNTNKELYLSCGFDEERSSLPNYYVKELSGSYSIKKTLPVFSDLSYDKLNVHNGTDAVCTYASYNNLTKEEYQKSYNDLIKYCKQDTWAMVVILEALRKIVK